MKQYRVNIKPTAENDIAQRYRQIAEESPQNALNWYLNVTDAISTLSSLAERCPLAPEDKDITLGIRHLVIGSYRVLFYIKDEAVEVLHVRHGAMERKLR